MEMIEMIDFSNMTKEQIISIFKDTVDYIREVESLVKKLWYNGGTLLNLSYTQVEILENILFEGEDKE